MARRTYGNEINKTVVALLELTPNQAWQLT
jgi:hypothetical protein